jgi:flagellar hook protein FlgE
MSFYTSLSGLKAAQTDLSTISNNVANVGSYGFKKSRAEFGDLVVQARNTPGIGTRLKSITQQFSQGSTEATSRELDLAIAGSGFFVTRDSLSGGQTQFTRNGSLSIDADRYLIDSGGGYVQVLPVDPNGNVTATGLGAMRNLQFPVANGTPRATSNIDLAVGLPASADIPSQRPIFTDENPYAFNRADPNTYNHQAQVTVYDSAGNAIPATVYFTRTESTRSGDANNSWEARLFVGSEEVSSDPDATDGPTPLTLQFDADGALTTPTSAVTYASVSPQGASAPLSLSIDFGEATNQATGTFTLANVEQDGATVGRLDDVTIGEDGLITASFSDGSNLMLGKLAMANFSNPSGLKQRGDAHWTVTGDSGEPLVGEAGTNGLGSLLASSLERSNVDVTEELVALISAQRNFQANAKAIETSNTITQAVINLRN